MTPLCAQVDPELFFPEKGGSAKAAKQICGRCPEQADCLAQALRSRVYGIWGGTSERDRDRICREQGIVRARPNHQWMWELTTIAKNEPLP